MNQRYENEKIAKITGSIIAVVGILFLLGLFFVNQRVKTVDVTSCDRNAENIVWKVEGIFPQQNFYVIKGYAYEKGISVDYADIQVLAYDEINDVYYQLPGAIKKRTDVTKEAGDEINYDYCGFKSVVFKDKIPTGCQLFLKFGCDGRNILVDTKQSIG